MLKLNELLSTPSTQLGKASRFVVFQIKLWSHCARLLKKNRSGQQAAALSYHTVFGIVPLAIVTLLIFQSFPAYSQIGEKMRDLVYREANLTAFKTPAPDGEEPGETEALTDHIDKLVARFFAETNKGQIGLFSVLLVIWAALALLGTIEKSFNNIWHVAAGRNFLHRIISYWALLTLGPLLVGVGIFIVTKRGTVFPEIAQSMLSYGVAIVAFFLLYFVLPKHQSQRQSRDLGCSGWRPGLDHGQERLRILHKGTDAISHSLWSDGLDPNDGALDIYHLAHSPVWLAVDIHHTTPEDPRRRRDCCV